MNDALTEKPLPLSLIVADRVYQDRDTGKWVLSGVFSTITVPSVPQVYDHLEVFFQVSNMSAPVDLRLCLEHAEGEPQVLNVGGPIEARDPLEVVARRVVLRNVPFQKAGKYWVMLKSGEEILTQVPLNVRIAQQSGPKRRRRE